MPQRRRILTHFVKMLALRALLDDLRSSHAAENAETVNGFG